MLHFVEPLEHRVILVAWLDHRVELLDSFEPCILESLAHCLFRDVIDSKSVLSTGKAEVKDIPRTDRLRNTFLRWSD